MRFAPTRNAHVLITGCTGFVGKVVLAEIMRRRLEFGVEMVYVLVRSKKGHDPEQRFHDEIAASPCFQLLPDDWVKRCRMIAGELTQTDCGISPADVELLTGKLTHIVHCAASVEFDLPLLDAAQANITSALNMLELARRCKKLKQMVSVSTAYVTPHTGDTAPAYEKLVPMPRDPATVYQSILDGTANEKVLLAETGHPNTYTFTKCITEHLLHARRGNVPLCIVRPSIVSATWQHPFPAWIDSAAAFAGFVLLIGAGHMRVLVAQPKACLDVVPCDVVADRALEAAFGGRVEFGIRYAVAGMANCCRIDRTVDIITDFFRRHPIDRASGVHHIHPRPSMTFQAQEMRLHRVPGKFVRTWAALTGQKKLHKQARKVGEKLKYVNRAFPYFTRNTFDFRAETPFVEPTFRWEEYAEQSCLGVYRHLMKRDETQMSLAGRKHKEPGEISESFGDLQWAFNQPGGNWAIRTFGLAVRKALRQCTHQVTFDRASFERAVAATEPGSLHIIIPTHRSYMDFLLCSYLFFARPDLGIRIPHIAAAEEFSRIPLLGTLFKKTHAFYLRRGLGKPDEALTQHVHDLVAKDETIQFFIEGARSRSRQFLPPRQGLLRVLQATGRTFTLLPVALTYDRVPEEESLQRELRGDARPEMKLRSLLAWTTKLARGDVRLGRVHMKCGTPVVMGPDTDVRQVSQAVMSELQEATAASTHHLHSFLQRHLVEGVTEPWLRSAIERRGGTVLDSPLAVRGHVDAVTEQCMRYHWMHLFYPEARALWPQHPAIVHHTEQNGWHRPTRAISDVDLREPRLLALLHALFEPVARDYAKVAESLGSTDHAPRHASARSLLHEAPGAHLPHLQAALEDLAARDILVLDRKLGAVAWGTQAAGFQAYKDACVWPVDKPAQAHWLRAVGA